jgi:hypothetical protein
MRNNNQDVSMVVNFVITIDSIIWDDGDYDIIFKGDSDFTFVDATLISEDNGVVTASVFGESAAVWSTPERVTEYFDEISESFDVQIWFGDYPADIQESSLYNVREYGI